MNVEKVSLMFLVVKGGGLIVNEKSNSFCTNSGEQPMTGRCFSCCCYGDAA